MFPVRGQCPNQTFGGNRERVKFDDPFLECVTHSSSTECLWMKSESVFVLYNDLRWSVDGQASVLSYSESSGAISPTLSGKLEPWTSIQVADDSRGLLVPHYHG